MLDSKTLRLIIKSIFNIDDDYIVPITSNWFVPDVNLDTNPGTYIGYRIMSKRNVFAENSNNNLKIDSIKVCFRLTFIGSDAEQLADQIYFWKDQKTVKKIFDSYKLRFNYSDMVSFSYPIKFKNFDMSWIFDLSVFSDYLEDLKIQYPNKRLKKLLNQ